MDHGQGMSSQCMPCLVYFIDSMLTFRLVHLGDAVEMHVCLQEIYTLFHTQL